MYNRYIPQADGSYRRSRMPDQCTPPPPIPPLNETIHIEHQPEKPKQEPPKRVVCSPQNRNNPQQRQRQRQNQQHSEQARHEESAMSFLRRLLPKDFDTGDLMIVLLLLLMAGDCTEDQNTALLTLALYFFM